MVAPGPSRRVSHLTARPEALVDLPRNWASFLSWSMNINSSVESAAQAPNPELQPKWMRVMELKAKVEHVRVALSQPCPPL